MKLISLIPIFLTTLWLSACANSPQLPDYDTLLSQQTKQDGRVCFRDNDISGFGILADDVISVDSRKPKEYFIVTTLYRCNSLTTSPQLGFVGGFGELCAGLSSKVVSRVESCPIKSIFKFESRKAAFKAFDIAKAERDKIREEFEAKQVHVSK